MWLPRADILQFEEIVRLARAFTMLGVRRVRITGGEPLLRRELPILVAQLAGGGWDRGSGAHHQRRAARRASRPRSRAAGLHRITVSLDTLRRGSLPRAHAARRAAARARRDRRPHARRLRARQDRHGRSCGDERRRDRGAARLRRAASAPRCGSSSTWTWAARHAGRPSASSRAPRCSRVIEARVRRGHAHRGRLWAPADRFTLADGTTFGIISSTTEPFCRTCDRSRLTADGMWFLCLYARDGSDLRELLRSGASRRSPPRGDCGHVEPARRIAGRNCGRQNGSAPRSSP